MKIGSHTISRVTKAEDSAAADSAQCSSQPDFSAGDVGTVLKAEDEEIRRLFAKRGVATELTGADGHPGWPHARFGLAFSGGGIRSAAVNLGLIQSLARRRILRQAHYISAVSGGGYILGWLTAWIFRRGFKDVEAELKTPRLEAPGTSRQRFQEPAAVRFLRRYVSFLAPRKGMASGDTHVAAAIYLRNVFLIQAMVACGLISSFAFLQLLAPPFLWPIRWEGAGLWATRFVQGLTIALGLSCWTAMGMLARCSEKKIRPYLSKWATWLGLALSIFLWAALPIYASASNHSGLHLFVEVTAWTAGLFTTSHIIANLAIRWFCESDPDRLKGVDPSKSMWWAWPIAVAGASSLFGLIILGFSEWLRGANDKGAAVVITDTYVAFGLPAVILAGSLTSFLYVGLLGNAFPDAKREWMGRLSGSYLYFAAVAAILLGIAMYGPLCIEWLFEHPHRGWGAKILKWVLPGGWLFTTAAGLFVAHSPDTGAGSKKPRLEFLAAVAPPVFLLGLLLVASWGTQKLAIALASNETDHVPEYLIHEGPSLENSQQWKVVRVNSDSYKSRGENIEKEDIRLFLLGIFGAGAGMALLLAWRVNVNEFSLHLFYRKRLVRTFLGASRFVRNPEALKPEDTEQNQLVHKPDPYTGFTLDDDIFLGALRDEGGKFDGPFPIWCTALNLTRREDLAWQKRKAASFVYTPLYCGWDAYRSDKVKPKKAYRMVATCKESGVGNGSGYGGIGGAPFIGTAMAASGAAFSPNSGYHTKPTVAALLALFNLRTGWWTGNPAQDDYYRAYAPGSGYFLKELLPRATEDDNYVYLSDGGHFDNLGIYELVRRRVRYILACDAGEDKEYEFGDLANAIEKCRVDFGVQICFGEYRNYQSIRPDPKRDGWSGSHTAVGIIKYPGGYPEGVLLYLKSSLTGKEPADVLGQKAPNSDFPHDPTLNQFFNETQFEAYRALGECMGEDVCEECSGRPIARYFESLKKDFKDKEDWFKNIGVTISTVQVGTAQN